VDVGGNVSFAACFFWSFFVWPTVKIPKMEAVLSSVMLESPPNYMELQITILYDLIISIKQELRNLAKHFNKNTNIKNKKHKHKTFSQNTNYLKNKPFSNIN
jgi:hypothetical protein